MLSICLTHIWGKNGIILTERFELCDKEMLNFSSVGCRVVWLYLIIALLWMLFKFALVSTHIKLKVLEICFSWLTLFYCVFWFINFLFPDSILLMESLKNQYYFKGCENVSYFELDMIKTC